MQGHAYSGTESSHLISYTCPALPGNPDSAHTHKQRERWGRGWSEGGGGGGVSVFTLFACLVTHVLHALIGNPDSAHTERNSPIYTERNRHTQHTHTHTHTHTEILPFTQRQTYTQHIHTEILPVTQTETDRHTQRNTSVYTDIHTIHTEKCFHLHREKQTCIHTHSTHSCTRTRAHTHTY